jgi:hypothetical protein
MPLYLWAVFTPRVLTGTDNLNPVRRESVLAARRVLCYAETPKKVASGGGGCYPVLRGRTGVSRGRQDRSGS